MAKLSAGYEFLAVKLQEASMIGHNEAQSRLGDTCGDMGCMYVDHTGDGTSGDVIYRDKTGDMRKAPYELSDVGGKKAANIDHANSKNVVPTVQYTEEADDDDHMATMEAARLYTAGPKFYERFISKTERSKADGGSFAGKGKSFPILKAGDVGAAVHAMGRAGSDNYGPAQLKTNIIRIAKSKGWESELPDAWKSGDANEAAAIDLTGDVIPLKEGAVGQDGTAYLKIIAPGWGSSGYYSPELLERDGPKVFKSGTKNFWDHQTDAEESARPEGSLRDLASVLTEDAHYEQSGPSGPGLYAKANVMPHFREHVDALSKHIGVSIRASGKAKEGMADGRKGQIIEHLTHAKSVDYVTTPGAGGKVLQLFEAARSRNLRESGETDMDAAEVRRLQESVMRSNTALARFEARDIATAHLGTIQMPPATRTKLLARITEAAPIRDGALDTAAFKTLMEAEIKTEADYLAAITPGGPRVIGLGESAGGAALDEKAEKARMKEAKRQLKEFAPILGVRTKVGRLIIEGGRAAFDPEYNAADHGALVTAGEAL